MSMTIAPARAADDDSEITLMGYDTISDMVELGDEVEIFDPIQRTSWRGIVIEVDDGLRAFYVRVESDTYAKPPQRGGDTLAGGIDEYDLYENKATGQLFTLIELAQRAQSTVSNPDR